MAVYCGPRFLEPCKLMKRLSQPFGLGNTHAGKLASQMCGQVLLICHLDALTCKWNLSEHKLHFSLPTYIKSSSPREHLAVQPHANESRAMHGNHDRQTKAEAHENKLRDLKVRW